MTNNNAHKKMDNGYEMEPILKEENGDTLHHSDGNIYISVKDDESITSSNSKEKLIRKQDEYIQSFTVHGLTRICTGNKAESTFWLLMLLCGLMITVYVVYRLVSKYLEFNIYTEVSQFVTSTNYLPAITFCDYNLLMSTYFAYCGTKHGGKHEYFDKPCPILVPQEQPRIENILTGTLQWSNGNYHVRNCQGWGSKTCGTDKFLKSLSRHEHACFTWNYNGDFYDAYSHAYVEFEVNTTGGFQHSYVVALVHDPRVEELDMTNRLILEPAKTYDIRISKTVMKRMPAPYPSNCTEEKPNDIFPGRYTRRTCMESLNYIELFKKCGDVMDYHKKYIPSDIVKKYKKNVSISEVLKCVRQFVGKEVEPTEECPFPCEEIELQTMSSFHEMGGKNDGNRSIYRIDIQYQNVDSYRVIEEKMLFSWDQVIGEVGGLLGLVIGASFISFIEILAYLYLVCFQKCQKKCSKT